MRNYALSGGSIKIIEKSKESNLMDKYYRLTGGQR